MKAAVLGENGDRDPRGCKAGSGPSAGAGESARRRPQPGRPHHGVGPRAWQRRRTGQRARARVRRRGRGGRQRGDIGSRPGERVMCSGNGGYAEYAVTDWGRVSPIPANNMGYEQAATLPVALQTMHDALVTAGRLKAGESGADPGRQLRRRPDGPADRQAQGRAARDRHLDQRRAARAAQGVRRRPRGRHHASRTGRTRCWRRRTARAWT